jgi:hypothetical protein
MRSSVMDSPEDRLEKCRLRRIQNEALESYQYEEAQRIQSQIDEIASSARPASLRRAKDRRSEIQK